MKLAKAILCVLIVSLLVSMAIPMASAKKGGNKPPPEEEPPADPAIAFYRDGVKKNPNKLMVMNDDGSNQAAIYEEYFSANGISWSPDGQSIAWSGYTYIPYVPGTTNRGIWRVDVEIVDGVPQGTNLRQLVSEEDVGGYISGGTWIGGAAWSPLGNEIAYNVRIYDGSTVECRIDAVLATGGDPYNIYSSPEGYGILVSRVTWSSDGTQLAFCGHEISAGAEGKSIMIIDRAMGTVTDTLLTGQFYFKELEWARQGVDTIIFGNALDNTIYTVDIETEMTEPIVESAGICSPWWSPDNSKMVYMTAGRKSVIATFDFATQEITKLGGGSRPAWQRF